MTTKMNVKMIGWTAGGILIAGLGVSVLLAARPGETAARPDKVGEKRRWPLVKVVRVEKKALKRVSTQMAHIEAFEKVDVQAKASGYILKLPQVRGSDGKPRDLDIGDRVKEKQVLAELWVPEMLQDREQKKALLAEAQAEQVQAEAAFKSMNAMVAAARAKVDQAQADLGRFESDVAYRKGEYERYRRLLEERTTNQQLVDERFNQFQGAESALAGAKAALATANANRQVEQARVVKGQADIDSAKAKVEVASANLKQVEILLEYATIRAPFDGVISHRYVDKGTFVLSAATGKSMPLFTVAGVDHLRVITDLGETDSAWVRLDQRATLRLDALRGQELSGRVVRFSDVLDPATRTMRVEVELEGVTAQLRPRIRPGLYGTLSITLADDPSVLVLPTHVLVPSGGKPAVMAVEEGVARKREIVLGLNDGIQMEVKSGLKAGDAVIAEGKDSVRDGERVEIAP